jgi:hypothetical protein
LSPACSVLVIDSTKTVAGYKAYLRLFLAIACVVVSIAAMINVFADNGDVFAKAKDIACSKGACDLARVDRTPFAQTYEFRTTPGMVTIRCARGTIFFGEYVCSKQ